ncbi:SAM-dependent RNA methyltransferase [Mycena floridula]|nr:SAM-dependent RNA methyltransferase [Mycena floridula]
MASFSYIIEHMEEDDEELKAIPPWVKLEYTHMRSLAGKNASVHFTNLSNSSVAFLQNAFRPETDLAVAECHSTGIIDLMKRRLGESSIGKICLLDPKAEKGLSPSDGDGEFEWFLFGGILGDDPPRDRTAELRVLGFPTRHLGPIQMTTDTALGVTKLVVDDKIPLDKIPYVDYPTITFGPKESVEMPFRYIADSDGTEPRLPVGMRELLREDLNKSFEF